MPMSVNAKVQWLYLSFSSEPFQMKMYIIIMTSFGHYNPNICLFKIDWNWNMFWKSGSTRFIVYKYMHCWRWLLLLIFIKILTKM